MEQQEDTHTHKLLQTPSAELIFKFTLVFIDPTSVEKKTDKKKKSTTLYLKFCISLKSVIDSGPFGKSTCLDIE